MAKFATASDALTTALATVNSRLTNINIDEELELYLELIDRRAKIQQAIGVTLSGDITIDNVGITSSVLPTGASTSALQSSVQADAGSDASKAIAIQGVTNGKTIPVSISGTLPAFAATPTVTANAGTNLNTSALALESGGNLAGINTKLILPSSLGAKTAANSISSTIAQDQTSLAQLTATGNTDSVSMAGYSHAFITVKVSAINTNVVIRIEGSNNGTDWANLAATDTDTTITVNGTYAFTFTGSPAFIRLNFVSESGGTDATIDTVMRFSA